ncbi:hypothetical protein SAMN05421748_13262 [Paractinoplanes atraurantiacus]|uniref:Transmembrane protein n=1 Tax=Paractinoplanes atraurantiacus TaxID=1036182 RepID=A0A285K920_9ACTN|nr:hypothetical protein SAMN05421748_13262 [Actinoplanes atraurantiacus]
MIPSNGAGLPAYSMPPEASARSVTTPFGVGEPAPSARPFGPTSSQPTGVPAGTVFGSPATTAFEAHGDDIDATMAVPQQRLNGTLYGTGGYETIDTTMPVSMSAVENSGSLTGHILAQGWHDEVVDRRRGNLKVAVAMLIVLGLLVAVSVVFLLTAGSSFSDMIGKMFE